MPTAVINDQYRITEEEFRNAKTPPKEELLARWMYSPGNLNKAHQIPQLTCFHCHPPFQRAPEENCRECHRPEDFLEQSTQVLIDTHVFIDNMNCLECHWEHEGARASISAYFDEKGHKDYLESEIFEQCEGCHSQLGKETHPTLTEEGMAECSLCHVASNWKETDWDHRKLEDLDFSNKGFTRLIKPFPADACNKCHEEDFHGSHELTSHKGDLSIIAVKGTFDCLVCHDFSKTGGD